MRNIFDPIILTEEQSIWLEDRMSGRVRWENWHARTKTLERCGACYDNYTQHNIEGVSPRIKEQLIWID